MKLLDLLTAMVMLLRHYTQGKQIYTQLLAVYFLSSYTCCTRIALTGCILSCLTSFTVLLVLLPLLAITTFYHYFLSLELLPLVELLLSVTIASAATVTDCYCP
jgi:hypothetical protein